LGTDWRQAWIRRDQRRAKPDDAAYWNGRAPGFAAHQRAGGSSDYTRTFLSYLDLPPAQSVLDMGCGAGNLTLPLAAAGHPVIAADFSAGMLQALREQAEEEYPAALPNIKTAQVAWADDWSQAGIAPHSVDVALASRSTMVHDLGAAIDKLALTARRRVAMTFATEYGPRSYHQWGAPRGGAPFIPDFVYALNILLEMGVYPELRYIDSYKEQPGSAPRLIRWAYVAWPVGD
jgi:SAM-dependent methyltransferase